MERTLTGLNAAVLECTRRKGGDRTETVHLIRTTVKQFRALLRLLRPLISEEAFARENARLKTAANRLASGRDQAVAQQTLTTLAAAADDGPHREALLRLKRSLQRRTAPAPARPRSGGLTKAIARSVHDLDASRRAFLRMNVAHADWKALDLPAAYRRARKRMKTALKDPGMETFHEWRVAVKRFYYQMKWLEPLWPKKLGPMIPLLHELEDALGADHDLSILKGMAQSQSSRVLDTASEKVLRKAMKRRSRHLRHRCRTLAKRLFHKSPRSFERKYPEHAAAAATTTEKPTGT